MTMPSSGSPGYDDGPYLCKGHKGTQRKVGRNIGVEMRNYWRVVLLTNLTLAVLLLGLGCKRTEKPAAQHSELSAIKAVVSDGGPVTITSSTAEFQILPSGYIQAALVKG